MRNGFTPPTHGVGSRAVGVMSGCQCPRPELASHWDGPNRPSPTLESSMALAAACPIAMPWLLEAPWSIAPSDVLRAVVRHRQECPRDSGTELVSGAVETRFESTSYAAVATAASIDAFAPARFLSRYG